MTHTSESKKWKLIELETLTLKQSLAGTAFGKNPSCVGKYLIMDGYICSTGFI